MKPHTKFAMTGGVLAVLLIGSLTGLAHANRDGDSWGWQGGAEGRAAVKHNYGWLAQHDPADTTSALARQ